MKKLSAKQMNKSLRRASAKKVREACAPAQKRLGPFCRRAATVGEDIVPTTRRIETPHGQTTCVKRTEPNRTEPSLLYTYIYIYIYIYVYIYI